MPELPELEVARERLQEALFGRSVLVARAPDPFVLRTAEPPLEVVVGRTVTGVSRSGKRLGIRLEPDLLLEIHLMRASRLRLRPAAGRLPPRRTIFVLEVEGNLRLEMTEASAERRASVRVTRATSDLAEPRRGVEPLSAEFTPERLATALRGDNRQLKGALRDPAGVAGIGNAYADEILHAARLSPLRLTGRLGDDEILRLHRAIVETLRTWTERVRQACPPGTLPERQKLWRRHFVVHGRAGLPCPVCGDRIARISYRDAETAYCPTCQNEGRVLADRRRSRLGIPPGMAKAAGLPRRAGLPIGGFPANLPASDAEREGDS